MFVFYAPKLYKYLDSDYDWSIAPSLAYEDEKLYRDLSNDDNVRDIFVFNIGAGFNIEEVFLAIDALREIGEFKKLRVDESTLRKAFEDFIRLVFEGNSLIKMGVKNAAHETVSIFINSILGDKETYLHPNKPNILVNRRKEVRIYGAAYNAFFSRYDRHYTPQETDKITAIADQLIREAERRFNGDFWTPSIWADEAISMMTRDLGANWRNEYVVWDCAAGTKNLTRDYGFKKLFSSTLHQSEINMSTQYNPGAISFQYDFLNDDIDVNPNSDPRDLKMPSKLFEALKNNEPIIFYTNPPYGQATNAGANGTHKAGIANNKIAEVMKEYDYGHATMELYTQFIFRVQKLVRDFRLTNVFFFFNKGFLVSPAFEKFTDDLLEQFQFNDGFMFNAGEFQGTSSNWGIIFSNFGLKKEKSPIQRSFKFDVLATNQLNKVEKISEHTMRRVSENETISSWLKEIKLPREEYNNGKYVQMSGAFTLSDGNRPRGRLYGERPLGYMVNNADNVQESERTVSIQSTSAYRANGTCVTSDNFERACVVYACRKSILPDKTWINDKDTFRRPSIVFQESDGWSEFVRDCVIYSLFHTASYQTSLRDFMYMGEYYDVKNEWFYMSKDEIAELASENQLNETYFEARGDNERLVYEYLHNTQSGRQINLSVEAHNLLEAGRDFARVCFPKRFMANEEHPEWHLLTWDAGYYQNYKIYTLYKNDEKISQAYERLNSARTILETKIRKAVYADHILEK